MFPALPNWLPDVLQASPTVLVQVCSYVGLVYTACEWLNSLPFEVNNVWKKSNVPTYQRCIYVLARYVGLVGQGLHLAAFNYLQNVPTASRSICNVYWWSQQYIGASCLLLLQIVLSKRVLALWHDDRRIKLFLICLFALDLGASLVLTPMASGEVKYINMNCFRVEALPRAVVTLCAVETFVQACLWTLTFVKYLSFEHERSNRNIILLVSRLNRQSLFIAFFAGLLPATVVADGLFDLIAMDMLNWPAFPVFLAIATCSTCQTVKTLHGEKMKLLQVTPTEEGLVLTSIDFSE